MTLESNLAKLPETCFGINPGAEGVDSLILIKRGERGYYPTEGYGAKSELLVDHFNARMGVTRAQRMAMEIGSMFGFDLPGADPDRHARLDAEPLPSETKVLGLTQ